jgi:hypothetical protein
VHVLDSHPLQSRQCNNGMRILRLPTIDNFRRAVKRPGAFPD